MKKLFFILLFGLLHSQNIDQRYHTTEEIYNYLDSLNNLEAINNWFHIDTIGFSTNDTIPILSVRISDNASLKEDEPRVLFIGQVHAEEILGVEIVMDLIDKLLFPNVNSYSHMQILKENIDIHLIPTLNPEGLNIVHDGYDVSFRKNKRDFSPDGPYPNGIFDYEPSIGNDIDGVDLNRNFSFNWIFGDTFLEPDNSDYASHYDYFRGTSPFSENEAAVLRDLALENNFVFSIVWHSSRSGNLSEKIFTSWKWEGLKPSPDLEIMKGIGDAIGSLLVKEDGTGTYLSAYSESRNGKLHDWFYRETGCFQYLIECGTSNLQPDSSLVEDTIDRSRPAMIYLMNRILGYNASSSQVTGIVYSSNLNTPIVGAVIEVAEHSGNVLRPRLSDEFGRYRRLLNPGTYNLISRAEGYKTKEISVVTNNSSPTYQDIFLDPKNIYELNINLIDQDQSTFTENGFIENEFGEKEVQLNSGENIFELHEDNYRLILPMDEAFCPIIRNIELDSNTQINLQRSPADFILINLSDMWTQVNGPWLIQDGDIISQSSMFYSNRDSSASINFIESILFDVSGSNRIVFKFKQKFETEWDHDPITIIIMNQNNDILIEKSWTGDKWENFHNEYLAVQSDTSFSEVKVKLKFSPDNSVNYRGWILKDLALFYFNDTGLNTDLVDGNLSKPKIPMSITKIYPNPSRGYMNINLSNTPNARINLKVFNLLGQEIYSSIISNHRQGEKLIRFDIGSKTGLLNSSGVYFIQIQSLNEKIIEKCVIIKNY